MSIFTSLLEAIAPFRCRLCSLPAGRSLPLCLPCQQAIAWNRNCCNRCALPLASGEECGACLKHPPTISHALAPRFYGEPVDELISALKYRRDTSLTPVLAELMAPAIADWLRGQSSPDALVPMPMHWQRQVRRGFNQAELIIRCLVQHPALQDCKLQPAFRLVRRDRGGLPQQGLSRRARLANLDGVFRCTSDVAGKYLVIVDDVLTTGATVEALARVLLSAGALRVDTWCCARTPQPCNP